jgi:hypothetical protein
MEDRMTIEESKRVRAVVGTATLLAMVLAGGSPARSEGGVDPGAPASRSYILPAGALIAPGDDPTMTLLYTGNVVGYVDPCG